MAQARWVVGETQPMIFGIGGRNGYGFGIQDHRGAPLLNVAYATQEEAEAAEQAVRDALQGAIYVQSYAPI